MLYITNEDKPGFIGALGTTLGAAGVNIATFHLGRAAQGQDAIALLELDAPIDAETLEKVRALPHTKQAEALRFYTTTAARCGCHGEDTPVTPTPVVPGLVPGVHCPSP